MRRSDKNSYQLPIMHIYNRMPLIRSTKFFIFAIFQEEKNIKEASLVETVRWPDIYTSVIKVQGMCNVQDKIKSLILLLPLTKFKEMSTSTPVINRVKKITRVTYVGIPLDGDSIPFIFSFSPVYIS